MLGRPATTSNRSPRAGVFVEELPVCQQTVHFLPRSTPSLFVFTRYRRSTDSVATKMLTDMLAR